MAYLPEGFDVPPMLPHELAFRDFCDAGELRIQRCGDCGCFRHPPQPVCSHCRSRHIDWAHVSGEGEVYSYTVIHQAATGALREATPYNVVVVLLDGTQDVRLISNLIDVEPEALRIGLRVRLVWETHGGHQVPRFRLADPQHETRHE